MAQLRADDLSPAGTNGVARTTQTVANQGSQANVVSTAGLVGYWPFDETSGTTAYDSSGNASNGSLSCSGSCASLPNWVAGKRNGALNFSLPNDLAAVADVPTLRLSTNFTISFWLKKSAGALNVSYISKGANSNGYQVATGNSGNSIYLNIVRNNAVVAQCAANGVILDQTWEHIAVTYNGAIIHFYINGAPSASCSATAAAGSDLSHLLFGGTNTSKPTGTMDEVRIYNRALSAQEIIAVYNDGGVTAPVSVSVAPANAVLSAGQTQQFSLTGTVTSGISWAISPLTGSVSSTGLYTAPGSVSSAQSVTVTARNASTNAVVGTAAVSLQPVSTLGTFQLSELFGVSWPDQPIEFRYDGGKPAGTARMLLSNGTSVSEVPFQWVSSCSDATATKGCVAVRSALPANATYTWTLQGGSPTATPVNPVQLATVGSNYEITNGLTGIRIITPAGNPAPFNLAPIQGIRLPGGTWTGAGGSPNVLYSEPTSQPGCVGCNLKTPMFTATGYNVAIVDSGPVKTVIQVTYTFKKPQYLIGLIPLANAGSGHYTVTFTVYANSKSVLVDEDTDMQFAYYIPLYAQLSPDTVRLRAHDSIGPSGNPAISGNNNPGCGYESPGSVTRVAAASPIVISSVVSIANGQAVLIAGVQGITAANGTYFAKTAGYPAGQFGLYYDSGVTKPVSGTGTYGGGGVVKPAYRGQNLKPASDGFLDLTYTGDRPTSYMCADPGFNPPSYMPLVADYPAAVHSAGWYNEFYKSGAGANAPVVGFYTGRASKQVYSSTGPSLPGIYTSNSHWITGRQAAGIQVNTLLRGPSGVTTTQVHRNWGIFVSTQNDLLAPGLHQPIANEQNSLTGINLSRLYTYQLVYSDPPGGPHWEYLSASSANKLISLVRDGTSVCGSVSCYYTLLKDSEGSPWGTALLNMWQGNSAAAVQSALNGGVQLAQYIVGTLANGDNHYDGQLGYYQLGLSTSPETAVLNAILMDSNSTPQQKTLAKACLALFGSLFWDDDWFPIDNYSGDGGGLANQVEQYVQYRTQAVAATPGQPFLSSMTAAAVTYPESDFSSYFSPTGAAAGSTHYQSAFFEPLILNYLNFSLDGTTAIDGYQPPMADPKWAAYANWELSIQTPPEPRFGGSANPALGLPLRKGYSNGDGNTEADVRTGMLGTALYPVNPTLAGNLMWAWQASNSATTVTEDAQFVTTLAVIDPTIPAVKPQLGSTNIPGYHSVERYNFGTPNETALWFINGDFYSPGGHRHFDDGQVSIYAHAAPLAIDWNADLYYPSTAGRVMHNSIVYDAELGRLWSADNAGLEDVNTLMNNATNTEFAAFTNSTTSTGTFSYRGDGTLWTRTVRTMNFDPSYPIIYVTDSFAGPSANTGKTLTWNLMATGGVSTPAGSITPTPRFSAGCQSIASQLPSNGTVSPLSTGLNRFNFTGFTWPKHATQGINWDLFVLSGDATQQFMIGNWGHGCHTMREAAEYQSANGSSFQEVQDILRVHDTGSFATIILPYQKTEAPSRTVSQQACGTQIVQATETTCFSNSAATFSNGTASILTAYDSSSETAFGVTVSGGPQEVVVQANQIVWTVGGATAGNRTVTLPGTWFPKTPVAGGGSTFTYSYPGGTQTAPVSIVFTQTP